MRHFKMLLLCSTLLYCIGQVIGRNIDLNKAANDIEKLRKFLNSQDKSNTDDTDQIFAKVLDSFKEEGEKKLLLSQIVPMYMKMLTSIKATEVKDSITNLSQMLYQSNDDYLKPTEDKLKLLMKLKEMLVSDIKVQRSAMKNLLRIYRCTYDIFESQHSKESNTQKCKRESIRRKRGC
ncbi:interferon gamma [Lithobates pipiens]